MLKVKLKELHPNLCGVDTLEGKKSQMFSNAKRAAARRLRFSALIYFILAREISLILFKLFTSTRLLRRAAMQLLLPLSQRSQELQN
uniref:Putative ovule protein n=1 Tax=Solanum chacoense TaxID=4108 RepID=A0A0V0H0U2_SOLCH